MNIKIKKKGMIFDKKQFFNVGIEKFEIEKDLGSNKEIVKILFKGNGASGIIEMTKLNVYQLFGAVKRRR